MQNVPQILQPVHERCHVNWVSHGQVRKILHSILHWYPYKIQIVQQRKSHDLQQRLHFALQFLARMEMDDMWPENILWSDEAQFTLEGAVNMQNCRIWDSTKPPVVHQWPLHSVYVIVWCGFTSTFILGPFSFKGLHHGGLSGVPWHLQVMKTSLSSLWFLPCKNITVLRPLFLCRRHHHISVAKFNACFMKPSQMNALSQGVFQILGLQDLLTWNHVTSGCGDTNDCVKDIFNRWLIQRQAYDMLLRFHENCCKQQLITPFYGCSM